MRKTKISIHCTLSNIKAHDNPETLHQWHVKENGWLYAGYHELISANGVNHNNNTNKLMRPLSRDSAAVGGHNKGMIAIALHGIGVNDFTQAQYNKVRERIVYYMRKFDINKVEVKGHNEYSGHERRGCPNFTVKNILPRFIGNLDPKTEKRI